MQRKIERPDLESRCRRALHMCCIGSHSTLEKAHRALAQSSYPKLLFAGNPGGLISPAFAESFGKGLKNCRVVQLSSGIDYLQEDHPEVIGAAVNEWLIDLGIGSSPKHKVAS